MAFRAKALTVIFIGMTVAGCSANSHTHAAGSGGSHHTSNSLPVSSRLPNIGDSSNSLTLPLTPYYASTQELAQDQNAQNALLSRCAQRAGFNYPVIVNQPETYGGDPGNGLFYDFGVVSLKFAETYGYHDTTTSVRHHTTSGAPIPSFGSLPVAEQRVLQQCLAQMTRQTRADDNWSVLVQNLALEGLGRVEGRPRRGSGFQAVVRVHECARIRLCDAAPGTGSDPAAWPEQFNGRPHRLRNWRSRRPRPT